jgi:hypothetical protein
MAINYPTIKRLLISLCGCIFVALLILNVVLIRRNKELSAQVEQKYTELEVPRGTIAPLIRGVDLKGHAITVDPRGTRNTILMVFTTTCGFCKKNWSNWESLIAGLSEHKANIVLIDLSSRADEAYLHSHLADGVTTISQLDPAMLIPYRLRTVPQTILIGADARVKRVWTGVLESLDNKYILDECSKGLNAEQSVGANEGR